MNSKGGRVPRKKTAGQCCLEVLRWISLPSSIEKKILRPIWRSFTVRCGYRLQKRSLDDSGSNPTTVARDLVDSQATAQIDKEHDE